ncbi:MAG TPA: CRISPR system precrRNA processing endoribonuclease RAMP protein Cas6 [Desulfuromonadaceae bacterium]
MDFNLVNLKITIRSADPGLLTLRLAGQGGGLAEACRSVACPRPATPCGRCPEQAGCSWHAVFGQELSTDPAALKRHQKPPLPFVLSFALYSGAGAPSRPLECGLVVIGRAISSLEMLLGGLEAFLGADPCLTPGEIIRIASLDYQGESRTVGDGPRITRPGDLAVLSAAGVLESRPWGSSRLGLALHSPLRLPQDGRYSTSFDFGRFARSLMRRISSLAYYYGDCEPAGDFPGLARQTEAIACEEDRFYYGSPPGMGKRMGGIMGSGKFSGDFSGLMPFLVLGTLVHAGKGASYGMGRYGITPA